MHLKMLSANWRPFCPEVDELTHWGRVTHLCVGKLTNIDSDNGLSPERRQAIIWTNAGILLIRTSGTNFTEIFSEIRAFSFKKMHLKMASVKWRPFCLGLNVLLVVACALFAAFFRVAILAGLLQCQWNNPKNMSKTNQYRKTSSISRTKSQSLNVSCILAQLSSLNPLKPGVKLRTKM